MAAKSTGSTNAQTELVRLNVNLNRETAAALREIAEQKDISFTEAVRRAISVYKYIEDEVQDGHKVTISDQKSGNVKELVLF